MSARDELASTIEGALDRSYGIIAWTGAAQEDIADAILAAGYRKPRTITTAEELDGLAEGAMILDADPDALLKVENGRWLSLHDADGVPYKSGAITFPATVLHEPTA